MNKIFNITMVGVGGQGIGLLSEVLLRAYDYANLPVKGVDTHGLAQRGGLVISHLRIGLPSAGGLEESRIGSPLVETGRSDLLISLERSEALRGMNQRLRPGGTCLYYDADWQSLAVRKGDEPGVVFSDLKKIAQQGQFRLERVEAFDLPDVRMQNMALLNQGIDRELLPFLVKENIRDALKDLLTGKNLENNLSLFP